MARRTTKPMKTASISVFPELPGAVFLGVVSNADVETARRMQAIRQDYEQTDCQATLWLELTQMGFGHDDIAAAVLNPRTITGCVYVSDCGVSLAKAIVAVA
jgi:hypothetical protein